MPTFAEAISFNLFGDLPLAGVGLPKLDIFGGRGLNPLDFEGIEAGAVLVQVRNTFLLSLSLILSLIRSKK